jgi:hypothetical protein
LAVDGRGGGGGDGVVPIEKFLEELRKERKA